MKNIKYFPSITLLVNGRVGVQTTGALALKPVILATNIGFLNRSMNFRSIWLKVD